MAEGVRGEAEDFYISGRSGRVSIEPRIGSSPTRKSDDGTIPDEQARASAWHRLCASGKCTLFGTGAT